MGGREARGSGMIGYHPPEKKKLISEPRKRSVILHNHVIYCPDIWGRSALDADRIQSENGGAKVCHGSGGIVLAAGGAKTGHFALPASGGRARRFIPWSFTARFVWRVPTA